MKLKYEDADKLNKKIVSIVKKHLKRKHFRIFVFGSRVSSENSKFSDIDIGIESRVKIPGSIMTKIKEEINNIRTLYSFDVVDFKRTSKDFKEKALSQKEVLYEQ